MLRVVCLLIFAVTSLAAEIHPRFYFDWQRQAEEFLRFRVEAVEPKKLPQDEYVATRVRGRILRVYRSKSRIAKGAEVEIRYTIFQPRENVAGPRPLPYLKPGSEHVFYGKVSERTKEGLWILEPTAGGRSFDTVTREEANL